MNQEEEEAEEGGRRPNFLCFSWSSSPERYYSSFSPGERLKIKFLNGRSTSSRWSFGAKEVGGRGRKKTEEWVIISSFTFRGQGEVLFLPVSCVFWYVGSSLKERKRKRYNRCYLIQDRDHQSGS